MSFVWYTYPNIKFHGCNDLVFFGQSLPFIIQHRKKERKIFAHQGQFRINSLFLETTDLQQRALSDQGKEYIGKKKLKTIILDNELPDCRDSSSTC